MNAFEMNLDRCAANYQPLSPIGYLERAAMTFPDQLAVVHGNTRHSYRDFWKRCKQLAAALHHQGLGKGDTVSVMLSNTPPMLEAHYGVPMAKAVLHAINTRLDAASIAFQLDHAETKILIVDREFADVTAKALSLAKTKPIVIDYDDGEYPSDAPQPKGAKIGTLDYEAFVRAGDPDFIWLQPDDEWDALSLNYSSGTTGDPKGVVYHHRGAALMCFGNTLNTNMPRHPVYLWTLPMFHCNGWSFPWTIALQAGTHICLRWVRAKVIYEAIAKYKVTHLCGAPVVMSILISAKDEERTNFDHTVIFNTAAAPPPETVLTRMAEAGFNVTHIYGLTETYGPSVVNEWHADWDHLTSSERASLKARQGVRSPVLDALSVRDPETMEVVPADGETLGEIMLRGNVVMKGYLKNPKATQEAFKGGWYHTGDLGVMHKDGYVQLKDRSKDIIISGGENISSVEVEEALYKHPAISLCGVVAKPHEKWGEVPVAFVELKAGVTVTEAELLSHMAELLAPFKRPKEIFFMEIPKTSTGKIQKFQLRSFIAQK
ncbi:acyl-CoA synthetase [Paenochrobactrum sp. BZR 588]|uniref:acyl-CoA synthetase n=1 Tax=Paenochrobactrum TaxID=999488 RepID=UPI0035BC5BB3